MRRWLQGARDAPCNESRRRSPRQWASLHACKQVPLRTPAMREWHCQYDASGGRGILARQACT